MASTYKAFLSAPDAGHLADDASINYITTTTVINEPAAILKHLQAQAKQVSKKEEKVLSIVEGDHSLCLETELTIKFNNGGGAYLPNMDNNLLDEMLVIFPVVHVVDFDGEQKIKQIRLHWDQGTLLKQVEAIGKTGRNWPIRDGKAQANAIAKSVKASGSAVNGSSSHQKSRGVDEVVVGAHKKQESISATRDPHASLNLFAARDPNEAAPGDYQGPKHAPRASAKPEPRNLNELFANGESPSADPGSKVRSQSPSKVDGTILKAGAGKHYTTNRLFENDPTAGRSPERKKVFNQKYDHFTFGDGEDVGQTNRPNSNGSKSKGAATFSFEDFSTPPKYKSKARPDDQVHWGQVSARHFASPHIFPTNPHKDDPPSPPKRPIVHAPRKDADAHFKMTDEGDAAEPPRHKAHAQAMALYHDPVFDEEGTPVTNAQSNTTNTNANRRGDDFGAHYSMTDSPSGDAGAAGPKGTSRSDMEQHWEFSSPKATQKVYKTAGDGMGGRKGQPDWMLPQEQEKKMYKTAGDGMGGRAGRRDWGIGDDSDPEVEADRAKATRGRRGQAAAGAGY